METCNIFVVGELFTAQPPIPQSYNKNICNKKCF